MAFLDTIASASAGALLRRGLIGLCVLAVSGGAAEDPSVRARNLKIVAETPGSARVFEVQANGDILHLQSGLRCPAAFPHVAFWRADLFPSETEGGDVGCDYARPGPEGVMVSKLTIFASKANQRSLDQVFESIEADIAGDSDDAQLKGPAIADPPGEAAKAGASRFGAFRSAQFTGTLEGGDPYVSDVVVAIRNGWVLEIRATFVAKAGAGSAADAANDLAGSSAAFLKVVDTLGQTRL